MRGKHHTLRIWLVLAVTIVSLGLASSASARLYTGDLAGPSVAPPPAAGAPAGFNWGDALVGAGAVLGIAVGCIAIALLVRSNRRLAT